MLCHSVQHLIAMHEAPLGVGPHQHHGLGNKNAGHETWTPVSWTSCLLDPSTNSCVQFDEQSRHMLWALNINTDGFTLEVVESTLWLQKTPKGALCIVNRHRRPVTEHYFHFALGVRPALGLSQREGNTESSFCSTLCSIDLSVCHLPSMLGPAGLQLRMLQSNMLV